MKAWILLITVLLAFSFTVSKEKSNNAAMHNIKKNEIFEEIDKVQDKNRLITIISDKDTNIVYMLIENKYNSMAISPIYNKDGTLMLKRQYEKSAN